MKRILRTLIFGLILIALTGTLLGCTASPAGPGVEEITPTPLPTPTKPTFTVQQGEIVSEAILYGRMVPLSDETAHFSMDGTVENVYVQVNDYVEEGQLLADLTVLAQLEQEWTAAVKETDRQALENSNVLRRVEIALEMAQLTLEQYRAENRSEYEIQIQELQVELAQMALDEVTSDPTLQAAANQLSEIEAQMKQAQLFAPASGFIIAATSAGKAVKTTTAAFVIGDISQLEASVLADDAQLRQLSEGRSVSVFLEGMDTPPMTGTIRELPYPYGSGSGEDNMIRVALNASPEQDGFQVGDKVRAVVLIERKTDVLWLPPEAVRTAGGRTFVIAETASGPKRIDITVGLQTRDRIEIASGLSEGQVVVGP